MIHKPLSESIIGAAMRVLNTLKPGLNEKAYENALVVELKKRGHTVQQQRRFEVRYDGILVDCRVPDIIVDDAVIADAKVVSEFNDTHIAQMIGYLAITGLQLALLLDFKQKRSAMEASGAAEVQSIISLIAVLSALIREIRGCFFFPRLPYLQISIKAPATGESSSL